MDVFGYFSPCKFSKDLIDLLPFPEDCISTISELKVNIMCLSETRREVFESSFGDLYDLLACLVNIHFDLFHLLRKLGSQFNEDFFDAPLVIFGTEQTLYQALGDFHLINGYLVIVFDHCL